jgi:cytochrome c-type biogenesis protein CcmH
MKYFLLLLCCLLTASTYALPPATNAVASTYSFANQQDAERFSTLTYQTRCVVCQFQNIADSNSPLAAGIREKIYQLIQNKKSDDEIKTFLVERYGSSILLKPQFKPLTALLWLFPLLALSLFAIILRRVYR